MNIMMWKTMGPVFLLESAEGHVLSPIIACPGTGIAAIKVMYTWL